MASDPRSARFDTRAVHAGEVHDVHGAPHTPLYDHTTFAGPAARDDVDVDAERVAFYTRYGDNPTLWSVQDKLAALHGADGALVFSSGMAAIAATLLAQLSAGDHLVTIGTVYGGTRELVADRLTRLGITHTTVPGSELAVLADRMPDTTRVVLLETPANPTLEVVDLALAAEVAHAVGARLVVDNTFATPVNQRPLDHGADVVVESATKYLGGHSDLTGGVAVATTDRLTEIAGWRTALGQVMAPPTAHRLARSLRTLGLRVRRHNATATHLAAWLTRHPRVTAVHHPSLATGTARRIVDRQMDGPGGLLSFEIDGGGPAADVMLDRLELITVAPSLGGVESLATRPAVTSHRDLPSTERAWQGVTDGLVRLSCGLEDVDDLIADLDQALRANT